MNYTDQVRLVARHPKKVNESDELFPADLINAEQVNKAVDGSDVVYLTVGLKYNIKIWEVEWPMIMHEHHQRVHCTSRQTGFCR